MRDFFSVLFPTTQHLNEADYMVLAATANALLQEKHSLEISRENIVSIWSLFKKEKHVRMETFLAKQGLGIVDSLYKVLNYLRDRKAFEEVNDTNNNIYLYIFEKLHVLYL